MIEDELVSCRQWADPHFRKEYAKRTGFVDIFTLRDKTRPSGSVGNDTSQETLLPLNEQ